MARRLSIHHPAMRRDPRLGLCLSTVASRTMTPSDALAETMSMPEPAAPELLPALPGPVVFFDGVCGLCNWSVDFLLRRDTRRRLWFAPLQGETAAARLGTRPDQDYSTIVLLDAGQRWERSDAVARILQHIGGIWGLAGWLLHVIPRPLRNLGYRIVASNRYSLFGKKSACRMPTPEERSRFLP